MKMIHTDGPEETKEVGRQLAETVLEKIKNRPVIIYLQGDLGAGKTQLTKGIGERLGITDVITSPSYVYMQNYRFSLGDREGELVHIDGWRTNNMQELLDIGIEQFLSAGTVVVIEWPGDIQALSQRLAEHGPYEVSVEIRDSGNNSREITVVE